MTNNKSTQIDQGLQLAYQQAHYQLFEPPLCLRIGEPNPALDDLLLAYRSQQAAFITVYNPYSRALSSTENEHRHQTFIKEINQQGWTYYLGQGIDPNGTWPAEQACLILAINQETATVIGKEWEQNAVVFYTLGGVAELLYMM